MKKKIKNYQDFTNEEINLKKALAGAALGAGLAISNPVSSQITTTSVPKAVTKPVTKMDYDSIDYKVGKDVGKLIGQDLYLPHRNLYDDYKFDVHTHYLRSDFRPSVGFIDDGDPEHLVGNVTNKYYKVIDIKEDSTNEDFQKSSTNYYIITLQERDSKKTYYYKYDDSNMRFPFIITGYFEKIRNRFINSTAKIEKTTGQSIEKNSITIHKNGSQIYINSKDYVYFNGNNLIDGRRIEDSIHGDYDCVDISLDEDNNIILLFENEKLKFYITYDSIRRGELK